MEKGFASVLLLTVLLAIGLLFFLRAASKDRTTVVEIHSPLPPVEVLDGISNWLENRGWKRNGGDLSRKTLRFQGEVESSAGLAIFLSILGGLGSGSLGLVIRQVFPQFGWWPLILIIFGGPTAGVVYRKRSERTESLELRLMNEEETKGSILKIRAHRDELIAMELELVKSLHLASDGSLLSSPI